MKISKGTLYNGTIYRLKAIWGGMNRFFYREPTILDTISSLESLYCTQSSLARFGDGEFKLIRGGSLGFQRYDENLSKRLSEVLCNQISGLEIGLPMVFGSLAEYDQKSARFWRSYLSTNRGWIVKHIDMDRTYCNSIMTRFWSGFKKDEKLCADIIGAYRKLWEGKDIIFVEGNLTRMGVGNDLFLNAKSVQRILCPTKEAWVKYDSILESVTKFKNDEKVIFILALGPTATVLAYDMAKLGMLALDLGHIDVQYEYYLRKATGKIALEGKYVNECTEVRTVTDAILDQAYHESIILEIQ